MTIGQTRTQKQTNPFVWGGTERCCSEGCHADVNTSVTVLPFLVENNSLIFFSEHLKAELAFSRSARRCSRL